MPRRRKEREYKVVITSEATICTTYFIKAGSRAEALASARSGNIPCKDEETIEQHDRYYEIDGEEIEP
jgi:hypothetical protein